MAVRSYLGKYSPSILTAAEHRASRRRAQVEGLRAGVALVVLDEIGCPIRRECVEQEVRKQAGMDIG
tara:strand:- start:4149 stop:4349 length:201 start_codon:yes stop_codon:yes gene_type:complete